MKSKNKIVKRTTAVLGLAAVPTAAALGLSYGIRDEKVNLSLSPANDFGERYFDNKIVKVNDDEFASNILYDPVDRNDNWMTDEDKKAGDLAGLVRLDRKLDIKYANSVIKVDSSDTNQGAISMQDALVYNFSGIKENVIKPDKSHLYGKDIITGMENDAKLAITSAILKYKKNKVDQAKAEGNTVSKQMKMGIYFEKNVIDRTVSIYLYELKDFDDEQNKVINDFINTVDSAPTNEGDVAEWIKNFHYNMFVHKDQPFDQPGATENSVDRIDGLSPTVPLDKFNMDKPTGFPEFFAGSNIMTAEVAQNWYTFGGIKSVDDIDLAVSGDGKIRVMDQWNNSLDEAGFKSRYPNGYKVDVKGGVTIQWSDIEDRINKSDYIGFTMSENTNPVITNADTTDRQAHSIGPIQFAEKGIIPLIEPRVDFKNHMLKIVYTFKQFRTKNNPSTRAVGDFNMGENVENPYKMSTYVKEVPLDNMGREGGHGQSDRVSISDASSTKKFKPFYTDETTNIDPDKAGYDSLKAKVVKAIHSTDPSTPKHIADGEDINRANAIIVLKEFLTVKTPAYSQIPIVGPGMGILGQMIPDIAASVQSWMDIGNMISSEPRIKSEILTDEFVGKMVDKMDKEDPMLNITEAIDTFNSFTKEAWSDLNSLISLSGQTRPGERTARTFQLFHMLTAINDITPMLMDKIKAQFPDAYMGSSTSVIDQLMAWLKKNGVIASDDSLMDIINNYRSRLGTIVETIGINRPKMEPELIQQLIDLIPLPLFSNSGSTFNRDVAAVAGYMLNSDGALANIIELLNGSQRTSVQTFFQHILNDNSSDLFKYILGVIGADFSDTETFDNAINSIIGMLKVKVPDYVVGSDGKTVMVPELDKDGNPVVTKGGVAVMTPKIIQEDGKDKMILNPTFSGIGIALEDMYNNGIHSVPKSSYDSIFKFIFGTIAPMTKMGALTSTELDQASQGFFDFITNGAGVHTNADGTKSETTPGDVSAIIRTVNAFANKEIVSPDLGNIIVAFMKNGVKGVTADDIKPLATLIMPKLKGTLGFADTMTVDRFSEIIYRLFNGWPTKADVIKDMGELVPALATTNIPTTGSAAELIGQIWEGSYSGLASVLSPQLNKVTKVFKNGLGGLDDTDWTNIVSATKAILATVEPWIPDTVPPIIDTLFNDDHAVLALQGLGHILTSGLGTVDYNDISNIVRLANVVSNSLKLQQNKAASISEVKAAKLVAGDENALINEINNANTLDDLIKVCKNHKDVIHTIPSPLISESLIEPLSFLVENVMTKGIDLSTMDIDTILQLAKEFAGSGFSSVINDINAGNPEEQTGEQAEKLFNGKAFQSLLIDFVVGHKYVGHEGDYAKDQAKTIVEPAEVKLLPRATKPLQSWEMPDSKNPGSTIVFKNPLWWDDHEYTILKQDFDKYKKEIETGKAYHYDSHGLLMKTTGAKDLTATQLFADLVRMQGIPIEMAKINAKVNAANSKIQVFIDALAAYKQANAQIQSVMEVAPSKTLTGDQADWSKSIDALFKLMQKNMLAASSKATFDSLFGGTDKNGRYHGQAGTITINDHKSLYFATKPQLEKLNDLMTELNSGTIGADFEDRMGKLFTSINTQFSGQGIKGVMPGMPAALKNMLKDFFAHNTVGSDGDAVEYKHNWFSDDVIGHPSSAAKSFAKFFTDNWKALFDHGGVFTDKTGRGIVTFLGGSWSNPIGLVTQITGKGRYDNIMFKDLVDKIHQAEARGDIDPVDTKLMQLFIDEFKKHIS